MTASPTILDCISAPHCWAPWFKNPDTWRSWLAFVSVLFGLALSEDDLATFRACTGRLEPRRGGYNEAWLICGRRGGKSFILALVACYLAIFKDWRQYLSPGEVGMVKVIACDRRQARVIHRYCRALLIRVPPLAQLVARDGDDEIELTNGISIEIQTASFRSVRGFTIIAGLLDEISFWRNEESANPGQEILDAIRPAMATVPGAMLLAASSPYARRGVLFDAYRRHYAKDDAPALVWKAPTRVMNPTVPQQIVDEAIERDPASAAAEYQAEFRSDIEAFISRDAIDAVTIAGRRELLPQPGTAYLGFVDPSGGSADAMTISVAHRSRDGVAVLDALRERRPPFSPEAVVAEFAALLDDYRVHRVMGDRYAGEWPREQFRKHGIEYQTSEKNKSEIYLDTLPLINSGKVELLDNPRLMAQLCGLERRTSRAGKDSIDHGAGAHDDIANSAAGALLLAAGKRSALILSSSALQRGFARMPPRNRFVEQRRDRFARVM
jgi:hypothetical protein